MFVYIVFSLLILFISLTKPKEIHKSDAIFFVFFAIFLGFRFNVGSDYESYVYYYELVKLNGTANVEIGFDIISYVSIFLGLNSQGMFLLFSIITTTFTYLGYKFIFKDKQFLKPVFFILLVVFFFPIATNGIRQVAAGSIVFYGIKYIANKNFIKYLIIVLLASLFHYSALILLLLYFFLNKSISSRVIFISLFLAYFLGISGNVNSIMKFTIENISFLDFGGYISRFLDSDYNNLDFSFDLIPWIQFLVFIFIVVFKNNVSLRKSDLIINGFFVYYVILFLAFDSNAISRLSYYFSIFMIAAIPLTINVFKSDSKRVAYITITTLYFLLLIYFTYNGYINPSDSQIFPYDFRFDIFSN